MSTAELKSNLAAPTPAVSEDTADTRAVNLADLKRRSVRGGTVTLISQGVNVAVQLASTIILARLLSPDDYGIVAMVLAITAFAGLFRDLGLSAAAIQKGKLSHAQMSSLFWINIAVGTMLTLLVAASAPLVVWFYGRNELLLLTLVLSTTFMISSIGTQHGALMQRELQFGRKAVTTIAGSIVTLLVAAGLAVAGHGYWALAWGTVIGSVVTTTLLCMLSTFRPSFSLNLSSINELLRFGANITAFDFVNYFHRNLDNLLIGRVWGPDMLGLYSRAYALLMFPISNLRGPINAVAYPAMSRLQDEQQAFRLYYRKVTALLALTSMPMTAFLFVAAAPIIELTLGTRWIGVAPIFAVLAITGFIQPVASLRGLVLLSMGQSKRYLAWGIFNAVCVSIAFVVGVQWGALGVASAYATVNYTILYPSLRIAFAGTALRSSDFFGPIARPAAASIAAVAVSMQLIRFVEASVPVVQVACLAAVFGLIFVGAYLVLPGGRGELAGLRSLVAELRRK